MKLIILSLIYLLVGQFKSFVYQPVASMKNAIVAEQRQDNKIEQDIKKVKINNTIFNTILAKTEQERENGLSNRLNLAKDFGMLFMMPQKGIYPFWMKDMDFALDFVWIDDNKIVQIDQNISLDNLPMPNSIQTMVPIDKVLELNAGACKESNIKVGDNIEFLYD
jgi:uncharacterized membrane protein (UPF0127 family)